MEDLPRAEFLEKVKKLDEARARGEPFKPEAFTRPVSSREWREKITAEAIASEPAGRREKFLVVAEQIMYRSKRTDATRYMARKDPKDFNNLFGQFLGLLKESQWSYEEEWRIVYPAGAPHANSELVMPTPSAIILGSQVQPHDERRMRDYCVRNRIALKRAIEIDGKIELKIQDA